MKSFLMKIDGTVVSVKVYLKPPDEVGCWSCPVTFITCCKMFILSYLFVIGS